MLSSNKFLITKKHYKNTGKYLSKKELCCINNNGVLVSFENNIIVVQKGAKIIKLDPLDKNFYLEKDDHNIYIVGNMVRYNFQKVFFRKLYGTYNSLVKNAINGLTSDYKFNMKIVGVGYKSMIEGNILKVHLNYSHFKNYEIPQGVNISLEKNGTILTFEGHNKHTIRSFMGKIRCVRSVYKGTGVYYGEEKILAKKIVKK